MVMAQMESIDDVFREEVIPIHLAYIMLKFSKKQRNVTFMTFLCFFDVNDCFHILFAAFLRRLPIVYDPTSAEFLNGLSREPYLFGHYVL